MGYHSTRRVGPGADVDRQGTIWQVHGLALEHAAPPRAIVFANAAAVIGRAVVAYVPLFS